MAGSGAALTLQQAVTRVAWGVLPDRGEPAPIPGRAEHLQRFREAVIAGLHDPATAKLLDGYRRIVVYGADDETFAQGIPEATSLLGAMLHPSGGTEGDSTPIDPQYLGVADWTARCRLHGPLPAPASAIAEAWVELVQNDERMLGRLDDAEREVLSAAANGEVVLMGTRALPDDRNDHTAMEARRNTERIAPSEFVESGSTGLKIWRTVGVISIVNRSKFGGGSSSIVWANVSVEGESLETWLSTRETRADTEARHPPRRRGRGRPSKAAGIMTEARRRLQDPRSFIPEHADEFAGQLLEWWEKTNPTAEVPLKSTIAQYVGPLLKDGRQSK